MRMALKLFIPALLALGTGATHAGDFATLNTIGFSADGKVFAFEQFGTRDGSGFPYSEIFFLDLGRDVFVRPSPVKVTVEDDAATVATARSRAKTRAATLFTRFSPDEHPGLVVADNPPTELSADRLRVTFLPRAIEPSPDRPVELRLREIPLPASAACTAIPDAGRVGYRLSRIRNGTTVVLHEDRSVPASRNCPISYAISRVAVHQNANGGLQGVALIAVKSFGFEGPDLRYIATPVPFD